MSTKNDITGDSLISKVNTETYRDNYDKIFNKKPRIVIEDKPEVLTEVKDENNCSRH